MNFVLSLALAAALAAGPAAAPARIDLDPVDDLPLTVVPSQGPASHIALLLTGDGGWASLADGVSKRLARHGVETIGFSTLRYFWDPKSAAQTARDLDRIFDAIRAAAPNAKVEVMGYSYGAAIAPVVYPLLSDSSKAMVEKLILLTPDAKAGILPDAPTPAGATPAYDFRTTFWQDDDPVHGYDIAQAIRAVAAERPVVCLYPSDDEGACPILAAAPPANVTLTRLNEGHHFGGDYTALAETVAAAL